MQRSNIIVLQKGDEIEVWGSITEICDIHSDISYHSVYNKKFPFEYKGYSFKKIPYRQQFINVKSEK